MKPKLLPYYKDKTENIMAVKSISEVKVTPVKQGIDKQTNFKVRVVDGKQYLVHTVLINDTLSMLSLKYNVSQ